MHCIQTETVKNNKPYRFRTRGVTQTGQWSPKSVQPCKSLEAMEELWSSTLEARFRALVDKSLSSSSMTTEEVSRLKSMESSIASTSIQTCWLPDFCLVANVTCPWQISANFRLLSLKKIGWHRIRVHSPHGVPFPYKKESKPNCPVLDLNNPRRLNGVVDLRLGRVVERHCSRGALQNCNE